MSAIGPKRTFQHRHPMSAFGVRAVIFGSKATLRLRRSRIAISCPLLGVKRTWIAPHRMSAYDPKRTFAPQKAMCALAPKATIVSACCGGRRCLPLAKAFPEPMRARHSGRPLLPFRRIRKWREHPSPSSPGSSRYQSSCLPRQRRVSQRRRPYHQGTRQ